MNPPNEQVEKRVEYREYRVAGDKHGRTRGLFFTGARRPREKEAAPEIYPYYTNVRVQSRTINEDWGDVADV